jgi:hypothetical protein
MLGVGLDTGKELNKSEDLRKKFLDMRRPADIQKPCAHMTSTGTIIVKRCILAVIVLSWGVARFTRTGASQKP